MIILQLLKSFFFLSLYKLHFGYNLERPLGVVSKAVITIVFKKILSYNSMSSTVTIMRWTVIQIDFIHT